MSDDAPIGPAALVALAVGGMVGGGIYVALGVVVEAAGRWAWLSFVVAGVVAVATADGYGRLSEHFDVGGGSFAFLERMDRSSAAGALSWVLVVSYTLTIALYGYAFGEYLAHGVGLGGPWPAVLSLVAIGGIAALDLLGAGRLTSVEVVIVTANLAALVVLAVAGLSSFDAAALVAPDGPRPFTSAATGAAAVFVSYEGFQLLTYERDEIRDADRVLTPGLVGSAVVVVGVYALVAVGATSLIGAGTAIEQASVALSVAAQEAFGTLGLVGMTVAACFATTAAINSTLFSTAQLARRVADDGELPAWLDHRNARGVPGRAVLVVAAVAAVLATTGSLSALVEAASLAFLAAFGSVNVIALRELDERRWVPVTALVVGAGIGVVLLHRLATERLFALLLMLAVFAAAFLLRPWVLRRVETEHGPR